MALRTASTALIALLCLAVLSRAASAAGCEVTQDIARDTAEAYQQLVDNQYPVVRAAASSIIVAQGARAGSNVGATCSGRPQVLPCQLPPRTISHTHAHMHSRMHTRSHTRSPAGLLACELPAVPAQPRRRRQLWKQARGACVVPGARAAAACGGHPGNRPHGLGQHIRPVGAVPGVVQLHVRAAACAAAA